MEFFPTLIVCLVSAHRLPAFFKDMKAGLYAKMLAVKALVDCGVKLRGDIIVQSVVEEESGGAGANQRGSANVLSSTEVFISLRI